MPLSSRAASNSVLYCGLGTNSAFVNSVPLSVWIIRMRKKAVRTRFNRNILDRELGVFLAVGHAIGRDEFDVHLEFLAGYAARSYGLFWRVRFFFRRGFSFEAVHLKQPVAALLRLFIATRQVLRILFCVLRRQLDFPIALLQGRVRRRTASIFQ